MSIIKNTIIVAAISAKAAFAQPGEYPNLSGAGTYGNPAIANRYGDIAVMEVSRIDGTNYVWTEIGSNLRGIQLNAALSMDNAQTTQLMANVGVPIGENLVAGAMRAPDGTSSVGFLFELNTDMTLTRISVESDLRSNSAIAAEIRRAIKNPKIEVTFSGKAGFDGTGKLGSKAVGGQIAFGDYTFSGGVGGGKGLMDWRDMKLHAGRALTKDSILDVQFKAYRGNFKKPAVTIGLTKMLSIRN